MTGSQQQPQPSIKGLDIEHWKLETRNGSRRLLGDNEPAPGIGNLPSLKGQIACTMITVCYFAYLWFLGAPFLTLSFIVTFVYFFLMVDRWRDVQVENLSAIQFISLVQASAKTGGLSPLLQFGILAPAAFLCIAPSGIGQTLPRFDHSKPIGRCTFILASIPAFILMAAQYWPSLDLVLVQAWNLVGAPIDRIAPWIAPVTLALTMMWVLKGRLLDIGTGKWLRVVLWSFIFGRAILLVPIADAYLPAADLLLAAIVFGLCLWPSRADQAGLAPIP
jgi:hypothetical protein